MSHQRNRGRALRRLAPLAGLVVLASCSGPFQAAVGAAKVDVDTLSTDILFGAPSPSPLTAQRQQQQEQQQATPPLSILTLPDQPLPTFFDTGNNFPIIASVPACPTAPSTSFPAQVATSDVKSMPVSGGYRWATGGTYDKQVLTTTLKLPLPTFEQRVVRHAAPYNDPVPRQPGSPPDYAFTYETIEPRVSDGTALLMHWQVKANANSVTATSGIGASDPEAGLVLRQVDVIDSKGTDTGPIFTGTPGLLLLPLPVQPGAQIDSTSVDKGGNTLKLKGTVGNRERVDACGEPIQAWGVDGTLTGGGASAAAPAKLHYDIATQFGALVVAFNIDGTFFNTQFNKATARIGQVKGDPVPDPYK